MKIDKKLQRNVNHVRHLEPVDLLHHIRLGQNALLGGLDPTQRHLPYWHCGFKNGDLTTFWHWHPYDWCHAVGRTIYGLCMAEDITGDRIEKMVLDDLSKYLFDLFDEADDLPGVHDEYIGGRFIILHNVRCTTFALAELIRRGYSRAEYLARRMVRKLLWALDENGAIQPDRLPCSISYTSQPNQEGGATDAFLHYYRVSGDEAALELAGLTTTYALQHCFTAHGALTGEAGDHGHSITSLVAGMVDLALLTGDTSLLRRVKKVYDVALPSFNSSFGWSCGNLDIPTSQRGEVNNTGDVLRGALLLGRAGFPEYFEHAERILRGHLLPSQVIDVEGFPDDSNAEEDRLRSLASRIRGGSGFRTPNDIIVADYINHMAGYHTTPIKQPAISKAHYLLVRDAHVLRCSDPETIITICDVTAGLVHALCEAWRAIVTEHDVGIRINLLLSCESVGMSVKSYLSGVGKIDIENTSGRNVFVRIPRWVSRSGIELKINGAKQPLRFVGPYLLAPAKEGRQTVNINFPMHEERTVETLSYKQYTIDWRGDQIVAMSPPGEYLPMFPPCKEDKDSRPGALTRHFE